MNYRQGNKGDCCRIAELDHIASGGAVEYLFHDLIPNKSALELLSDGLEQDVYSHTFRSCIVAEFDQNIIGMALSYPAHLHCITDELTNFLPVDRLEKFHEFYSARVEGSYFLDAMCIDKAYRGLGVGKSLLEHTKSKAISEGYNELSLIVFSDNSRAIKFYKRQGFRSLRNIKLEPHKLLPHNGGCLLMKVEI
ncbi:GNAT family N-acetyltransferase [Motiliproteus sp. MSK22-1]|uniref:GNAT family N-acetyltransferase n=1 Tax=Motiliproteus sp. MSK22-1 TaxID=1897630 RepID=UPI001E613DB1|nr:GNAT family N-acetyltransferase [Motiliproteus sp. MSK22-1]